MGPLPCEGASLMARVDREFMRQFSALGGHKGEPGLVGLITRRVSRRFAMAEISRLPRPVADEWEWQFQGACRSVDPEVFFHPDGERGPRRRQREMNAKAICATCPVIQQCREHALKVQEPFGIWGGLSEDDRLAIYAKQGRSILSPAS